MQMNFTSEKLGIGKVEVVWFCNFVFVHSADLLPTSERCSRGIMSQSSEVVLTCCHCRAELGRSRTCLATTSVQRDLRLRPDAVALEEGQFCSTRIRRDIDGNIPVKLDHGCVLTPCSICKASGTVSYCTFQQKLPLSRLCMVQLSNTITSRFGQL